MEWGGGNLSATWMSPSSRVNAPGTLGGSMLSLHQRIADNCARLEADSSQLSETSSIPATRTLCKADAFKQGLARDVPENLGKQLEGFMAGMKEDLSKHLIAKMEEITKSGQASNDAAYQKLFDNVEQEKRKLEDLEDKLLYGDTLKRSTLEPVLQSGLTETQQAELLPLLDQIERTILSSGSFSGPSHSHSNSAHLVNSPPQRPAPPPGPPPPPPPRETVQRKPSRPHSSGDSLRLSRQIEHSKQAFDSQWGRQKQQPYARHASRGVPPPPPPGPPPPPPPPLQSYRDTESLCSSRSSRRALVEPHTLHHHHHHRAEPPRNRYEEFTAELEMEELGGGGGGGGGGGYAAMHRRGASSQPHPMQPPPPPGRSPYLQYTRGGGGGGGGASMPSMPVPHYDAGGLYQSGMPSHEEYYPQDYSDEDVYYEEQGLPGSNWEVEETELQYVFFGGLLKEFSEFMFTCNGLESILYVFWCFSGVRKSIESRGNNYLQFFKVTGEVWVHMVVFLLGAPGVRHLCLGSITQTERW